MQTRVLTLPHKNCVRYGLLEFSLSKTGELQIISHQIVDCIHLKKGFVKGNFCRALGQFTRNYTQTTKRGLLTTNKG